jgi:hypothetical protein
LFVAGVGRAATPDATSDKIWRLVAKSHLIVVGIPQVPIASIRQSIATKDYKYLEIIVRCDHSLKATVGKTVAVRWYTGAEHRFQGSEELMAINGKQAVFFLIESDDPSGKGFYLVDDTRFAFVEAKAAFIARVCAEVKSQQELLRQFDRTFAPKGEPLYVRVKSLIDATTRKDTQMAAFRDLEALGLKGVPAMILLMDDRRELAVARIAFRTPGPPPFFVPRVMRVGVG